MGTVTIFAGASFPSEDGIRSCYLAKHPDARRWLPHDKDAAHIVCISPALIRRFVLTCPSPVVLGSV